MLRLGEGDNAQAQAALALIDVQAEKSVVLAPAAGAVLARHLEVGEIAAPGGHVMFIGSSEDDRVIYSSGTARRCGLTLRAVRRSLNTLRPCLDLCAEGMMDPGALVTHTFAARDAAGAFEAVERAEDGLLKAVVDLRQW